MTKKILITGKNSYIGQSFIEYCEKNQKNFEIDELSTRGEGWKTFDFSSYDSIFHVAGIAHMKETKENESLYYKVNKDLAINVAQKAKKEGVNHFIFMSTMSVYGLVEGNIDYKTETNPINAYGKSKLAAEDKISSLSDKDFIVSIIRPPMIYGPGCKGNYPKLSNFAKTTKFFPTLNNERSMLFVGNLNSFLIGLLQNPETKTFYPQNKDYVSTKDIIKQVAKINNNKVIFISIFNPLLSAIKVKMFKKVFGTLKYDKDMSIYEWEYNDYSFNESILITEEGKNESSNN